MAKHLTEKKAKLILHEGEVRGHPLADKQRGFFGARASGMPMKRGTRRHNPSPPFSSKGEFYATSKIGIGGQEYVK